MGFKWAVTVLSESTVMVVIGECPDASPLQRSKVKPGPGTAMSVTKVPDA